MYRDRFVIRLSHSAFALLLLAGCAADFHAQQPANVILENVHLSGAVVAFNTDSSILASGGLEGKIQLSGVPRGETMARITAHRSAVSGIAFLDAKRFVSAGNDSRIAMWDTSGQLLREIKTASPVSRILMNTQDRVLLTGHKDGMVRIWGLPDLTLERELALHRSTVLALASHAPSRRYASSSEDGRVLVWSMDATSVEMRKAPSETHTLQFSPDGRALVGGGWFNLLRWDVANGSLQIVPTEHHGLVYGLRYVDEGKTLVTVSRHTDSAVYFVDAQSGAVMRRFQRHDMCVADVTISPNGRYLATTSDDYSVRMWDLSVTQRTR